MAYVHVNNPGNMHASSLTVGAITNTGAVTGSVTLPVTGAGLAGSVLTSGAGIGTVWSTATNSSHPTVNIHQRGIDMEASADIKIGDQSLKEFMKAVSDRLAILVPDPAKLEKYAALKAAYEHYKLLESLINDDEV